MVRVVGRFLVVTGAVLIGVYVVARTYGIVMSRMALHQFSTAERRDPVPHPVESTQPKARFAIDFNLWSTKRIAAYEASLSGQFDPPEAVLEVPKIGLTVPVFDGTDDLILNRGVGRIGGTALPGQKGNTGIAGHRDGFFRGLKDVVVGDTIELKTPSRDETYKVDAIRIVKPTDVEVLKDRGVPTITLVTCYPFYFIGSAPMRYIVQASLLHESARGKAGTQSNLKFGKIENQEKTR